MSAPLFCRPVVIIFCLGILPMLGSPPPRVRVLAPGVELVQGPVNGLLITRNGKTLAVYGDPGLRQHAAGMVLFTHHRRDVVWAGRPLVEAGAMAIVPAAEAEYFSGTDEVWRNFAKQRYHDYASQTSKFPVRPLTVSRTVRGGDMIAWQDLSIEVLDTPGYTRGAVSYLLEIAGKRIACIGDLMYGEGQLLDIYSLQEAVPELKIRGYHGWAARTAAMLESLAKVAAWKPDILVPARRPAISEPQRAISTLTARLRGVYANHAAADAYRWYIGDDKFGAATARVLGTAPATWIPRAEIAGQQPPEWIRVIGNSRLIVSASGGALLVDAGFRRIREELRKLRAAGVFRTLEGIHITHYHDDHTDEAQAAAEEFDCPVFASSQQKEILEQPARFRMPCLTTNAIRRLSVMPEAKPERWHEFRITGRYFPGQTLYHDSLLVEKDGGETVFFTGDSFTPTGLDDYCLLNRNLLHEGEGLGYFYCLRVLGQLPPGSQLINQHVIPTFRFSPAQIDALRRNLEERAKLLRDLLPWDDPSYGLDEQWARLDPYSSETRAGREMELRAVIFNHSPAKRAYRVTLHAPPSWGVRLPAVTVEVGPRREGAATIRLRVPSNARGLQLLTADIAFGAWDLREWAEALINVDETR